MNESKCSRCDGEVASGLMKTEHPVSFYPKDAPLFSFRNVSVSAQMCLDCGFIELWGDVERARQLLKRDS